MNDSRTTGTPLRISANKPCPCHSGRKAKSCCLPFLKGQAAPDPTALMRSRYTAYAIGAVQYILNTTHPDGPHHRQNTHQWLNDVRSFSAAMSFDGLVIHESQKNGSEASVSFSAKLSQNGQDRSFTENSRFVLRNGHWLYHSALS